MRSCPQCGGENPEHARFCLHCAAPLRPAELRRKERKFATALFADLVGSTTLAEQEDPEVVQSVVGRAFDRLAEEVRRHEGLLEKFMGDALLAVFGVPRAHEDDAERAVRAALEMRAIVSELNRGFAAEGKPQLAMRIGLEAGEVLVDIERASGARDRMLTGDAVNTAARLQSAAESGRVVVGPGVYAATKEVIEYRELPPLELKGKAERVPAWEALRITAKQRGERPRLGMEARLVGRDEELEVLKQTFRRVETEGRPALVTVVGPAGVGKSRLVHELERHLERRPEFVYWRRGRCLAYGNTSYSALADAIKAQCEILEDDPAEVAAKKADHAVHELFGDETVAPQIRALVGAGEPGSFTRQDLFDAWRRFLERMAARYPLVVMLEDIHWADAGLLDFVEHAADWAQGPIMLVALARPELFETRPSWGGGRRNAASIYLDPLSPEEGAAMLKDLLSGNLESELRSTIVARSEGNPLFVEEIVRMLIDDGVLRATAAARWEIARPIAEVEVPRSIQSLIATRLDGLPDDEKTMLQDAAVVGRVFWTGAVARLTGHSAEDVRDALGRLRVKELVLPHEPSSFSGEHEFTFKHVLIRDGAYDSLPKSLRAEKHAGVAAWAEERAGDRAEETAELIATHYLESLRYLEELGDMSHERAELQRSGYRWARAAGDRANALWLQSEAERWYREALRLGQAAGAPIGELAPLARAHVGASWQTRPLEATERAARRALELAETAGDGSGAGWAMARLAFVFFQLGRDEEIWPMAEGAVSRLEPLGESEELAEALNILGWIRWRRGRHEEAEPALRRSVDVATRIGAPVVRASATQNLAVTLDFTGRSEEGLEMMEEAYRLAKDAGDLFTVLRACNNFAWLLADTASDYRRACEVVEEGLQVARKAGSTGMSGHLHVTMGELLRELGDLERATELTEVAVEVALATGDEPLLLSALGNAAIMAFERGLVDEAREALARAKQLIAGRMEPQRELQVILADAYGAIAASEERAVIECLGRGVELLRTMSFEQGGSFLVELVRSLVRDGDRSAASAYRDLLEPKRTPNARAFGTVVEGLLAEDPAESVRLLREAADELERIGRRVDLARVLLDLGKAMERAGEDPGKTFERARDLLVECDARLWLPEAESALADATRAGR